MKQNESDEIIGEVRAARQAYAARLGYDIRRIVEDLKTKEACYPERRAKLQPVSITRPGTPSSLHRRDD